jgi:hypothetical protein
VKLPQFVEHRTAPAAGSRTGEPAPAHRTAFSAENASMRRGDSSEQRAIGAAGPVVLASCAGVPRGWGENAAESFHR